jgi:hypothetical protein
MPMPGFRSFRGTSILFLQVQVASGVPLLADDRVEAILRDAWLEAAVKDRWFVGAYWIRPQWAGFFASRDPGAVAGGSWVRTWKAVTAARINAVTNGRGPVWEDLDALGRPVTSEADYELRLAAMQAETHPGVAGGVAGYSRTGMIWQLLPGFARAGPLPAPRCPAI